MSIYESSQMSGVRKSVFDLSYEKKLTCDMGQLIPVMCDEVVPGDRLTLGNQVLVRMQPMVSPPMHEINIFTHTFFVPYRLLWKDWENFITGGVDGEFGHDEEGVQTVFLPRWTPPAGGYPNGSLWDYMGLPSGIVPNGTLPMDFPRLAYNFIYNEYYRDQNFMDPVDLQNDQVLLRCWEKDRFTSALPWQQRGVAPALPITGSTFAKWADDKFAAQTIQISGLSPVSKVNEEDARVHFVSSNLLNDQRARDNYKNFLHTNVVDFSEATTFNVSDLRLAFQVQKWLERNARGGGRYTEFIQNHFNTSPRDERLQRPEYIGGSKSPITISEVLQTSSSADLSTPQGNLAGHGISGNVGRLGKYHVKEFGLVMSIMSIMPRSAYQQGINRQWLRETKYDFPFPEFTNLSEQPVLNAEICATENSVHNNGIFGYQGRYDEMRSKQNIVCGLLKTDLSHWHLGRIFDPANPPALNKEFLECNPLTTKRIFAVTGEPGFVVNYGNLIKAVRPIPINATPGYIDH